MSYASGTTHYNLPQTVGSDKRDWTDTNQAFSDIDAAIYGAAQGASAATSAIETINGEIETITAKQAIDEGNISTLSGKVSTLESTVGTQATAIADVRQDLQDNIESKREASATSTHAYAVGDTFYYNDILYKATASISIGDTIVPNTNCTAITVMSEMTKLVEVASVTGTSGMTMTNLIHALVGAISDYSVFQKGNAKLVLIVAGSYITFNQFSYNSSAYAITFTAHGAESTNMRTLVIQVQNNSEQYFNAEVTSNGFSYSNLSSNSAEGTTLKVYAVI